MTAIAAAAVTAGAVLAKGWCSPQCLVGTGVCGCRCGGQFPGRAAAVIGRPRAP